MNNVVKTGKNRTTCKRKFGRDTRWFLLFKKMFNIKKIEMAIQCEGIKILPLLYKLDKISDPNLKLFIENGNIGKFASSRDKEEFLKKYLKNKNKTFKIKRNNSANSLSWFKINKKKDDSYNNILLSDINSRSLTPSTKIVNYGLKSNLSYGKKVWISIGINNYKFWPNLLNAESDAIKITTFAKEHKFYIETFLNYNATKDNIEKIFKDKLYKFLNPNDLLIFSFHGHGTNITIDNKEHGFIVPYSASCNPSPYELISMEEFTSWIRFLKSRHVLLLFDCCFSGFAVLRGARQKISQSLNTDSKNNEIQIAKKTRRFSQSTIQKILSQKNKIAITAGTSDQQVLDGGWDNNSAFTGLIISYPGFKTGIGSILELYTYLLINVPKYSNQTPCIGKLVGDQGGDIFLSL